MREISYKISTAQRGESPHSGKASPGDDTDAELFELLNTWDQLKSQELALDAELEALERASRTSEPIIPPALLLPVRGGGRIFQAPHPLGWFEAELRHVSPVNLRELLTLRRDYESSRELAWADARAAQMRFTEFVDRNTQLLHLIGRVPASTARGLVAKCMLSRREGLFLGGGDFSEFADGLTRDVEALAPGIIAGGWDAR